MFGNPIHSVHEMKQTTKTIKCLIYIQLHTQSSLDGCIFGQLGEPKKRKPHSDVGLFCVYMLLAISYSAKTNQIGSNLKRIKSKTWGLGK